MKDKLTLEKVGEIVDGVITNEAVALLIEMPAGTQEPRITGSGIPMVDLYTIVAALRPALVQVVYDMGGSKVLDVPAVLDGLWAMIRADALEAIREAKV